MRESGWALYALFLMGGASVLALLHGAVWRVRRAERIHLWAALWYLASALFIWLRYAQFTTESAHWAFQLVRLQFANSVVLAGVGIGFTNLLCGQVLGRRALGLLAAGGALLIGAQWLPVESYGRLLTHVSVLGPSMLAVEPGWLPLLTGAISGGVALAMIVRLVRSARLPTRPNTLSMGLVLALVVLCGCNDLLVFAADFPSVPIFDVAVVGMGLTFSGMLVRRYSALASDLEVLVRDRTDELTLRNADLSASLRQVEDARTSLQRSGQSFRTVIETSPNAVVIAEDDRIAYANARAEELRGACREGLMGLSPTSLFAQDDHGVFRELRARARITGKMQGAELRIVGLDGTQLSAEIRMMELDFDGRPATALLLRDLTEERRQAAHTMLTDRMASVGTLAGGVAHEINNPLTFVLGNAALLRELVDGSDLPDLAAIRELATDIELGAQRVRRTVKELQIFARSPSPIKVPVDPRKALETAVRLANAELRHRVTLERDLGQTPPVLCEEARLGQVFVNLLVNAAHATPEGARDQHTIHLQTTTEDGAAVIRIRDDGAGIPAEILRRVFDPFFTTKPVGKGTGLGLSICHGIITELGGQIEIASTVGAGTTVTIRLPSAAPVAAPVAEKRSRVESTGLHILIIENEPLVARTTARTLAGNEVTVVESAQAALSLIATGPPPDLILCDLMMPNSTGMDFHAELRVTAPSLCDRVVFVTGGVFTSRAEAFVRETGVRVLHKPFEPDDLRALVAEMSAADPRRTPGATMQRPGLPAQNADSRPAADL